MFQYPRDRVVQTKLLSRQGAYGQIARLQIERKSESSRGPELELLQRGDQVKPATIMGDDVPEFDEEDLADLDDAPDDEVEDAEAEVLDQATAARTNRPN